LSKESQVFFFWFWPEQYSRPEQFVSLLQHLAPLSVQQILALESQYPESQEVLLLQFSPLLSLPMHSPPTQTLPPTQLLLLFPQLFIHAPFLHLVLVHSPPTPVSAQVYEVALHSVFSMLVSLVQLVSPQYLLLPGLQHSTLPSSQQKPSEAQRPETHILSSEQVLPLSCFSTQPPPLTQTLPPTQSESPLHPF
jgi:hypothetical protein